MGENVKIDNNYIEETIYKNQFEVWCRKSDLQEIPNKFELLCKTVKYLTKKSLKDLSFTILSHTLTYPTCICSCNKCHNIYVVKDEETDIAFGVGSLCINKFENEKLNVEYRFKIKGKKCDECNEPLIKNENKYLLKNSERGKTYCYNCKFAKIYLNVSYEEKEHAKLYGAKWDLEKKKWWIYKGDKNYDYLIKKYKLKKQECLE